jgi:hypothetical protein
VQLAMRLGDTPYFVLAVVHSEAPVFLLKSCYTQSRSQKPIFFLMIIQVHDAVDFFEINYRLIYLTVFNI